MPLSSDHWFEQIVVLEKNEFNSPMCDDKVLVSEVNRHPSTSLFIISSVKSFVLLYGFFEPFSSNFEGLKRLLLSKGLFV